MHAMIFKCSGSGHGAIMLFFYSDNALIVLCTLITVNVLIILRSWSLCAMVFL
jgi:hypothetical protein